MTTFPISTLLNMTESEMLSFKSTQYRFYDATDDEKSELLKDIISLANASTTADAFIVIGIAEANGRKVGVRGVSECLQDNDVQEYVNCNTNHKIRFRVYADKAEGQDVNVIQVARDQHRPIYLPHRVGTLEADTVYIRSGRNTSTVSAGEAARMVTEAPARPAKHEDDDLRIFHPFFTVAITIGLMGLAAEVFTAWRTALESMRPQWPLRITFLFIGLMLVGLRMIWAVESLSRFMAADRYCAERYREPRKISTERARSVTLWHYPALLAHAVLIFFLCKIAAFTNSPDSHIAVSAFFFTFAFLLAFNAFYQSKIIPSSKAAPVDTGYIYKPRWILTNYGCAISILSLLIYSAISELPTTSCWVFVLLCVVLFANSFIDLAWTAPYYVPRL